MINLYKKLDLRGKSDARKLIEDARLYEYGVYHHLLYHLIDKLQKETAGQAAPDIAFGLNNNDFDRAFLSVVKKNTEAVLLGIRLVKDFTDAKNVIIFLPDGEEELGKILSDQAPEYGIRYGIIPVREFPEYGKFHLQTAYECGRMFLDKAAPRTTVFLKLGDRISEGKRIPFGSKPSEVFAEELSAVTGAKAFRIGTRLYTPEEFAELEILPQCNIGNGVVTVLTEKDCLLLAAETELLLSRTESCGKCTFCREGLLQIQAFLSEVKQGKGGADNLDIIREIGEAMDFSSLCSIGQRGADFILDSLDKFRAEYDAHMRKQCPAGVCFRKEKMYIDPAKCVGCGKCAEICEEKAIYGRPGYVYMLDQGFCTLCGKCREICPEQAIILTEGALPKLPDRPVKVGKGAPGQTEKTEKKSKRIRRPEGTAPEKKADASGAAAQKTSEPLFDLNKFLQEENMKTYDTQVCIVAGGPAGLSAAVQAAERGMKVIVLEKAAAVGGAANMGMGPLGIGTKYQKAQMVDITVEKAFNMFMEYTHYQVDARLVKRYFSQSASTIEWLESMGVEFEGAYRYFPQSECTWHIVKSGQKIGPRAASFMNKALYNKALELGVQFLLETRGLHIVKEDGAVSAVLAETNSGEKIRVNCKAAVIATGGAGANPEMIYKETGYTFGKDMFNFAIPGITGDGLRMAWEAGVDHVPVRMEQAAMMVGVEGLPDSVSNIFFQPNLLVNAFGKRFMNEEYMQNTTFLSNAVSNQKDRTSYSIVDDSIVREYIRNGVDVVSMVRSDTDVSDFYDGIKIAKENHTEYPVVADSIEELAEKLSMDPEILKETIEEYNGFCDTTDTQFFKPGRYLKPIYQAPFYANKIGPGAYGTVGGIRINENCEACDSDFYPIPGLYAAGADACNLYNDSYMFLLPGNSMGFAVNTGRIAGMEAADYVREL